MPGRLGCAEGRKNLGLHCVEGVLWSYCRSVSEIKVFLWSVLLQVLAEIGPNANGVEPILSSAQHAINTTSHIYTEYEVLEMTETPITVYPQRTAADQQPAFEDYRFQTCSWQHPQHQGKRVWEKDDWTSRERSDNCKVGCYWVSTLELVKKSNP